MATARSLAPQQCLGEQALCHECGQPANGSTTDELTGLLNRRGWNLHAPPPLTLAAQQGRPCTLAMIDADRFKHINDSQGHLVGDQALCRVADALTNLTRRDDVVCRFGGDEFTVLFVGTDLHQAVHIAQRIQHDLADVTVSIGLATFGPASTQPPDMNTLLHNADQALLAAKATGRNRIVCAPPLPPNRRGRNPLRLVAAPADEHSRWPLVSAGGATTTSASEEVMDTTDHELMSVLYDIHRLLGRDWIGAITVALQHGPRQYCELRDETRHWSFPDPWSPNNRRRTLCEGVLVDTLTRMTQDGLLIRHETPGEWHTTVHYELSTYTYQILTALQPLITWARHNRPFFDNAQHNRKNNN